MARECAFILPSGKKCRCMANRNHKFCRHHGAPSQPKAPPTADRPWNRLACWRSTVRALPTWPKEEIPYQILQILYSLMEDSISDRTAGRILRSLLQRYGDVPLAPSSDGGLLSGSAPAPNPTAARIPVPNLASLDEAGLDRFIAQIGQLTRRQGAQGHGRL